VSAASLSNQFPAVFISAKARRQEAVAERQNGGRQRRVRHPSRGAGDRRNGWNGKRVGLEPLVEPLGEPVDPASRADAADEDPLPG